MVITGSSRTGVAFLKRLLKALGAGHLERAPVGVDGVVLAVG
jgi:hypothetical protein